MPQINAGKTKPEYDVIVFGSGVAGGQTAYTLGIEGVKVLMLEAGRDYDPVPRSRCSTPTNRPLRRAGSLEKPFVFYNATIEGPPAEVLKRLEIDNTHSKSRKLNLWPTN